MNFSVKFNLTVTFFFLFILQNFPIPLKTKVDHLFSGLLYDFNNQGRIVIKFKSRAHFTE